MAPQGASARNSQQTVGLKPKARPAGGRPSNPLDCDGGEVNVMSDVVDAVGAVVVVVVLVVVTVFRRVSVFCLCCCVFVAMVVVLLLWSLFCCYGYCFIPRY